MIKRRLGDMLVEAGKITPVQLQKALKKQQVEGKKLGEVLIEEKLVTENDIMDVLKVQLGIEKLNLDVVQVDNRAVRLLTEEMCKKNQLFPFQIEDNFIKVAMVDPLNIFAIDDVSISTGLQVKSYIATKEQVKRATERYYSNENVLNAAIILSNEKKELAKSEELIEIDDVKNAPVVKMVDYLLKNAVEQRASDIHIEPYEDFIRIRYRIDGQLQKISTLDKDALPAIVTRIKILGDMNIAEKRIPQDGRIITSIGDRDVDMRVSILPLVTGEKVVIRILDRNSYKREKKGLGLSRSDESKLDRIIGSPYGIILVTGPTGSGKSTTLYTILNEINKENKNIITVEDPVEYSLDGVNQVNVNQKAGLTFANGLRSILRQDPDVIMIGEIRDGETAEIAIRASITGHLVLSTLHTNDAASSIVRMIDMGIPHYLVATSISGVIAQRLVKRICPNCATSYEASNYEKHILGVDESESIILTKGKGCAYCNNTGYAGRTGVYEIMEITREHRELIVNLTNSDVLKDLAIKNGMKTIEENCRELVLKGITTIDELAAVSFL